MDSQLRRGILDACVLAVLEKGESYGYQLIKDLNAFIDISESTLYPILKRLEQTNMLCVYTVEHNGRLRKYYRITDEGHRKIDSLLSEWEEIIKVYKFITEERNK